MTEHKNVHVALAAAQAVMGPAIKGASNPAFKSRYADLSDVVAVVRPALSAQGIAYYHQMTVSEAGSVMRTVLVHGLSETSIECDVPLIVDRQNMQGMKSATTYAKRIGLESLTGIAAEDDDGNAAVIAAPSGTVNADQRAELDGLIAETDTDPVKFAAALKTPSIDALPAADFERAKAMLLKKRDRMAEEARARAEFDAEQSGEAA